MLQNRVDPFGNIITTKARGHWMGNRGILHNEEKQIVRLLKLKAWLICKLEFNGRKRKVMDTNRYTELFLDEATAFAAGHRPCFECRRQDFNKFKTFWLKGNPEYHFDERTSIQKIDDILHKERMDQNKCKVTYEENINSIPNGTFILYNKEACLFLNNQLLLWSPFGYKEKMILPNEKKLTVLTPRSLVNTFRGGYTPQIMGTFDVAKK